jgi:hypothetical protein
MGEYVLDVDAGVDELFFVDRDGRANGIAHPGRFAPTTGVCFLLTTPALLLLDVGGKRGWRPSEAAALPVAVISGMAILGYAYSLPAFYGPSSAAKMAVHTAGCFAALMGAIALARPHGRVLRLATTTDPGGVMVRRLALVAVCVPLVVGGCTCVRSSEDCSSQKPPPGGSARSPCSPSSSSSRGARRS